MFEVLEKNFELINANLLKSDINLKDSKVLENFKSYIAYCYSQVDKLLKDVNKLIDDKCTISLADFEKTYEERVLYRIDDITDEMYILQNFLELFEQTYTTQVKELLDLVDDVEAILMLLPEEIEKNKCIMLTFEK